MNKNQISELLIQIGLSPAYKGYSYLVHIIYLAVSDKDQPFLIIKELYEKTAKHFGVTAASIQHSIRTLLDAYWIQDASKHFYRLTKYPAGNPLPPKEFIAILTDYIQRWQN